MSEPRSVSDQHTPGPWRVDACGGFSTVICPQEPARADNRIPAYAYKHENGYCIAHPFADDSATNPDDVRWDFVCFSHADARLIATAPDMLDALRAAEKDLSTFEREVTALLPVAKSPALPLIRAAIAKAEGKSHV